MEVFDIAIVGFGANGIELLIKIQNEAFTKRYLKPNIAIFDNSKSFTKGKAFGDAATIQIVNTPPDLISPSAIDPNGYSYWLNKQQNIKSNWPARNGYRNGLKDLIQSSLITKW